MNVPKEILDPNAVAANAGPWNPALPVRRWVDKRASDTNNTEDEFNYFKLAVVDNVVKVRSFSLGREEAAVPNIPPAGVAFVTELDFPVRQILPSEVLTTDPFKKILYQDLAKAPATGASADRIVKILAAIAKKLEVDISTL